MLWAQVLSLDGFGWRTTNRQPKDPDLCPYWRHWNLYIIDVSCDKWPIFTNDRLRLCFMIVTIWGVVLSKNLHILLYLRLMLLAIVMGHGKILQFINSEQIVFDFIDIPILWSSICCKSKMVQPSVISTKSNDKIITLLYTKSGRDPSMGRGHILCVLDIRDVMDYAVAIISITPVSI